MAKKDKGKKKTAVAEAKVEVPVEETPVNQGMHTFRKPSKFR